MATIYIDGVKTDCMTIVEKNNVIKGTNNPSSAIGKNGQIYLRYGNNNSYIRSTGTQYMNLGYIYKLNSKIVIDCICHSTTNAYPIIFGCQDGASRWVFCYKHDTYGTMYTMGNDEEYPTGADFQVFDTREKITAQTGKIKIETLYDKRVLEKTVPVAVAEGSSSAPLWLFQRTGFPSSCYGSVTIYDIKIYEGNTLVKHYIPYYNNDENKYGLYEEIDNEYFYSANEYPLEGYIVEDDETVIDSFAKVNDEWQSLIGTDINNIACEIPTEEIPGKVLFKDGKFYNQDILKVGLYNGEVVDGKILCHGLHAGFLLEEINIGQDIIYYDITVKVSTVSGTYLQCGTCQPNLSAEDLYGIIHAGVNRITYHNQGLANNTTVFFRQWPASSQHNSLFLGDANGSEEQAVDYFIEEISFTLNNGDTYIYS